MVIFIPTEKIHVAVKSASRPLVNEYAMLEESQFYVHVNRICKHWPDF